MDSSKIARMLGKIGGEATAKKYGSDHYRKMGLKSGVARKERKDRQNIPT